MAIAWFIEHVCACFVSCSWRQGTFDVLLQKQLKNFTDDEKKAAKKVAVPIARALVQDR